MTKRLTEDELVTYLQGLGEERITGLLSGEAAAMIAEGVPEPEVREAIARICRKLQLDPIKVLKSLN